MSPTQQSQEWHDERLTGLGGSDVAAIVGVSPWGSAMTVYLSKIGAAPPVEESAAMEWGTRNERAVAEKFADEHTEFSVVDDPSLRRHAEYDFAIGHFDRLLCDVETGDECSLLECKTARESSKRAHWTDAETGELRVPDWYVVQVQWYLAIAGLPFAYLSVLFGGYEYVEFVIEADAELHALLLERAAAFWKLVESRTPPPIDASTATSDVLAILYSETIEKTVDLPKTALDWIAERDAATAEIKSAEERKRYAENELKAALGENETGVVDGFVVTWKPTTRKGYTVEEKTYRTLRVKPIGDEQQ